MSGLYSRRKGLVNEYKVRDLLRAEGFAADRVPSSGAAEGFPGDIKCSKDGKEWLVEVKVRAGVSFKHLYDFYNKHQKDGKLSFTVSTPERLWCIDLADTITKVMAYDSTYLPLEHKGAMQAVKLYPMLKECNFLVVRNDRMPFLWLRYRA